MSGRLIGTIVRQADLEIADVGHLYRLFAEYYLHVDRKVFDQDLEEKDWVLMLRDAAGNLHGFTTLVVFDVTIDGREVRAAFNGNTIIDHDHWGQQELVRTWTRFMAERKAEEPATPHYWYLICSGYRTYLYLPLFYRSFYPRYDRPTPEREQHLLDALGRRKFPDEYRDGVIRVKRPRECLRGDLAEPPAHKLRKPHVHFFVERNPGWRRGDELACAAEFTLGNIRGFPREIARRTLEVAP